MSAAEGPRPGTLASRNDIFDLGRVENALHESSDRLRRQFKAMPIPTYKWQRMDDDFVLVDYNDAAEASSKGNVIGR
jgi:hypothetical protein